MGYKIIDSISSNKTWIHKDFKMTKENDVIHIQIKKHKMTVPISKFMKFKDKESGRISINKYTFEIPILRVKDAGYLSFSITLPNGKKIVSQPMYVCHFNSDKWQSFIDFLLNQQEILSLYYEPSTKRWHSNVLNQIDAENRYHNSKSEFPAHNSSFFHTELLNTQKMVTEYLANSSLPIVTDNFDELCKSLNMNLPSDRFFDVEKFYGVTFNERNNRIVSKYGNNPVTLTGFSNQKGTVLSQTYYAVTYLKNQPSAKELENKFMFGKNKIET